MKHIIPMRLMSSIKKLMDDRMKKHKFLKIIHCILIILDKTTYFYKKTKMNEFTFALVFFL